jgi:DNA-binding GntR family transcriptional regulator
VTNWYAPTPAYQQVAADLRSKILTGELAPGAELPSYRALADQYGVSHGTLTKAIARLRDAGLVETGTGVPTTVRQQPKRKTAVLGTGQTLVARMPTAEEQEAHQIDPGVPVIVLTGRDGHQVVYAGIGGSSPGLSRPVRSALQAIPSGRNPAGTDHHHACHRWLRSDH